MAARDQTATIEHLTVEHLEGCPAPEDRMETFELTRPKDRQVMTISRCMQCGQQKTKPTGRFEERQEVQTSDR